MVLLLFFFVLAVPGFAAAEHAQTVLRVGFVREEGYLTIDQKGYYSGYAYEYLQTLSQYGSWRCEYLEGTWEQCLERLRSGEIDVMAGISDTAENEQSMAFSSLPMGRTHMDFVVRGGQRNLRSFVGSAQALRYGKLSYDPSSPGLERMAKQQGIRLQPKLYRSMDQMTEDYVQGRLDGFSSSLQHRAAFPVAAFFDVTPLYLAVRKGNTELLDKLDRAMESMELLDPQRQSRLFEKYYRQGSTRPLSLTEEEREYLQQKGSLIAVGTPGERPHSYFEHGEYRGNLAEIMRRIAADLGITFEYIETQSNEEAIQLLNEGRADIITEFYCDYNWGRQHHLHLTTPFMQLHYAAVTRRGTALPERPRIAVARGHFYVEAFVVRRYPDEELVYFDTMEECLRAVSEGNADLAFMKSDMTQYSIRQGDFMNLMPSGDVWFTHDVSIGVSDQADPVLLRILNKEINHLDPELIQRIMAKSLLDQKETVSLKILAYNHPLEFFGILLFIAVLIITSLIYILQIRRRHTKHIQELAYTDPVTGLHNQYWFEQHVPKLIEEHLADMKAQLVVVVLGMSRMDILLESYGREFVREQLCVLAEELRMQADWVKVVTSVSGHLLLLCRMDSLPDFVELLQQALQEYTAVKRSELNLQLNLKAGVCVLPRRSDKLAQTISCAETAYAELYGVAEVVQVFDDKLQQELDCSKKSRATWRKPCSGKSSRYGISPNMISVRTASVVLRHLCAGAVRSLDFLCQGSSLSFLSAMVLSWPWTFMCSRQHCAGSGAAWIMVCLLCLYRSISHACICRRRIICSACSVWLSFMDCQPEQSSWSLRKRLLQILRIRSSAGKSKTSCNRCSRWDFPFRSMILVRVTLRLCCSRCCRWM